MTWLIVCGILLVGFIVGYATCGLLVANRERMPVVKPVEVEVLSPQAQTRMGEALYNAGEMLNSGDFEYVSGGFMVQDLGHGVVNFKGDLSLRAKEVEDKPKGRDFIGMKK